MEAKCGRGLRKNPAAAEVEVLTCTCIQIQVKSRIDPLR